jgi:hypothetical protein
MVGTVIRTISHKVGLAKMTLGPSDMDEQLFTIFMGPNERFWGGRTDVTLCGTLVTRTKHFWDSGSKDRNVRGQSVTRTKGEGTNVKAPFLLLLFIPLISLSLRNPLLGSNDVDTKYPPV